MRAIFLLLIVVLVVTSAFEFEFDLFNHESLLTVPVTAEPTADPTLMPSAMPSLVPSASPTLAPTLKPTASPSLDPTASPTLEPSLAPSNAPSLAPTNAPTLAPTLTPTASPSLIPTASPTLEPSLAPSPAPTLEPTTRPSSPSAKPTRMPTKAPTYRPSFSPTNSPTEVPTANPTALNLIAVVATQALYGITPAEYVLDKVMYNKTLQHTISDVLDGVEPDDIKNIVLNGADRRRLATNSVTASLTYHIIFHDNSYSKSYDTVVAQLQLAASNGDMNKALHDNAANFGAYALVATNVSATVDAQPLYPDREVSKKLTGTEITGLIIGIFLCLGLIAIVAMFAMQVLGGQKQSGTAADPSTTSEAPANPPSDSV